MIRYVNRKISHYETDMPHESANPRDMTTENDNYLRAWRKSKGMNLQQAGEAAGHDKSQLSKLERDDRRISRAWLIKLARVYGCRPADLLGPPPTGARPSDATLEAPLAPDAVAAACQVLFDELIARDRRGNGVLFARTIVATARRVGRLPSGVIDLNDVKRFVDYALDAWEFGESDFRPTLPSPGKPAGSR